MLLDMFGRKPNPPVSSALKVAPREGEVVNRCCGGSCKSSGPVREDEGPTQADVERFSGVTRTCPACCKEVFDDAAICYHCGQAFDGSDARTALPRWALLTAAALLVAVLFFILSGQRWF